MAPEMLATEDDVKAFAGLFMPSCWCCGDKSWILFLHDGKPAVSLSFLAAVPGGAHLPSYTLSCETCGTLWAVNARLVEDWIFNGRQQRGAPK